MLPSSDRGRLTLPDLAFITVGIALIGVMYPAVMSTYNANATELSTGEALLYQLMLPAIILVFMAVIYRTATTGGGQ